MIHTGIVRVLLVEDDEDDYVITKELFSEMQGGRFALDWAPTFEEGLDLMVLNQHEVCLVDYRLGASNGVELLQAALRGGCQAAIILLTGAGEHQIDLQGMEAGAADFLIKPELQANSLERAIRYALQRKRAAAIAAFEQARLAAFGAEIGLALTRRDSLEALLERCATAMVQYLGAGLAQLFTFDANKKQFELRATAGPIPQFDPGGKAPIPWDFESLSKGKAIVVHKLADDSRLSGLHWARDHGVVGCAAYPLMLEDNLVGLMSLFSRQPLSEQISLELGSVANGIALCIERKRSEQALGLSEVKYRSVVESIKEVIFQMDEFGHWTFLNPAWTAVTQFEVDRTLGTFFLEYIYQEDRQQNQEIFIKLLERSLDYYRHETRFLTRNGKIRWVEMYLQLALNSDGGVRGVSGSLTDITERKAAESQIQKLAAFPRVNPNPVLEFTFDGTLTYANDAASEMARSLGREDLTSILPPNAQAIVKECLVRSQKRLREEVNLDGRTITWSFFPVPDSHVVHCYGTDVTEVLNLEAQFRHAQKLESVGQLAAGVAHDFNNILTVIQGYSDCLLARCNGDQTTRSALKQISSASQRAAGLTRQLLMFSRKQIIQTKALDLNAVLQNLANMLPRLLGEHIGLRADYAHRLPRIEADTGMLEQVVMNLAVNARDAMPKSGNLLIATSTVVVDESQAKTHPDSRPGKFVCLTVTDSGTGMDRKTLERIFEPFFTTKEVGKGTGLGLATVYGIVKQHQGWIEVTTELERGTTFKIYFPATLTLDEAAQDQPTSDQPLFGSNETILLVEDEPVVREMVREILQTYSYRVIEASSGVEALRIWDEHQGRFDLLLTDMIMPEGLSGRDLAQQLRARKPGLRTIFTSGYSPDVLGRDFGHGDTAFIAKPYLPQQLAQIVRHSLESPPRKQPPELAPA